MKVTEVRAIPLAIPLRETTPPSTWAAGAGKQILVRLATDDGLTGWGECFAYGATLAVCNVVEEALAPIVLGQDPTQIESLVDRMQRALMIWGRRGLAMMAVSGVELGLRAARWPLSVAGACLREPPPLRDADASPAGRIGRARSRLHGDQAPSDRRRVGRRRP